MTLGYFSDWYFVYLLKGNKSKWIYIGVTTDLKKRMISHNDGATDTTNRMGQVRLIYYEAYNSRLAAIKREKALKHHGSALSKLKARIGRAG